MSNASACLMPIYHTDNLVTQQEAVGLHKNMHTAMYLFGSVNTKNKEVKQ